MKTVVGMSGGVDSAVAALLLKRAGDEVIGVFMDNWEEQNDGECTARQDFSDVRRVCDTVGIPYYSVSFAKEYQDRVFSFFLKEYEAGRTPNPDIMCNREIKFDALLDFAMKLGADRLATGHYARTEQCGNTCRLLKGVDAGKDQSYFLCELNQHQLKKACFPLGGMQKSEVRQIAAQAGLSVAEKKDSTGICFIGERRFREFLQRYIPAKEGEMRTLSGKYVGKHCGVMYYTLGQRHGLGIGGRRDGGEDPWFVVGKDVKKNILYVEQGEHEVLFCTDIYTEGFSWTEGNPPAAEFDACAKFRYRQPDRPVRVTVTPEGVHIKAQRERAVTPGQSAVLYIGDRCLGGGVVSRTAREQD